MRMILRNIRSFLLHHTGFFILMLCCVLSSAAVMLFSFGLYQNYQLEKEDFTAAQKALEFPCSGVKKDELKQIVESLDSNTHSHITLIFASLSDGAFWDGRSQELFTRFVYQNGAYHPYPDGEKNLYENKFVLDGRYFTDVEYQTGEKVMLVSTHDMVINEQQHDPQYAENGALILPETIEGYDTFPVCGEDFTPIMMTKTTSEVPFPSVPAETEVLHFSFDFDVPPTDQQAYALLETVQRVCGDRVTLPEITPAYEEDYTLYNTIMLIAVLIAAAAAVNIVILYYYILLKRRKTLAVCMLCGCTRGKAVLMYLGESLLLTLPLFALAVLLYDRLLLPALTRFFPFIQTAYSPALYLRAMGIYVGVCTAGMLLLSVCLVYRRSIRDIQSGGAS